MSKTNKSAGVSIFVEWVISKRVNFYFLFIRNFKKSKISLDKKLNWKKNEKKVKLVWKLKKNNSKIEKKSYRFSRFEATQSENFKISKLKLKLKRRFESL